jgi:hypothetical protein
MYAVMAIVSVAVCLRATEICTLRMENIRFQYSHVNEMGQVLSMVITVQGKKDVAPVDLVLYRARKCGYFCPVRFLCWWLAYTGRQEGYVFPRHPGLYQEAVIENPSDAVDYPSYQMRVNEVFLTLKYKFTSGTHTFRKTGVFFQCWGGASDSDIMPASRIKSSEVLIKYRQDAKTLQGLLKQHGGYDESIVEVAQAQYLVNANVQWFRMEFDNNHNLGSIVEMFKKEHRLFGEVDEYPHVFIVDKFTDTSKARGQTHAFLWSCGQRMLAISEQLDQNLYAPVKDPLLEKLVHVLGFGLKELFLTDDSAPMKDEEIQEIYREFNNRHTYTTPASSNPRPSSFSGSGPSTPSSNATPVSSRITSEANPIRVEPDTADNSSDLGSPSPPQALPVDSDPADPAAQALLLEAQLKEVQQLLKAAGTVPRMMQKLQEWTKNEENKHWRYPKSSWPKKYSGFRNTYIRPILICYEDHCQGDLELAKQAYDGEKGNHSSFKQGCIHSNKKGRTWKKVLVEE